MGKLKNKTNCIQCYNEKYMCLFDICTSYPFYYKTMCVQIAKFSWGILIFL